MSKIMYTTSIRSTWCVNENGEDAYEKGLRHEPASETLKNFKDGAEVVVTIEECVQE